MVYIRMHDVKQLEQAVAHHIILVCVSDAEVVFASIL